MSTVGKIALQKTKLFEIKSRALLTLHLEQKPKCFAKKISRNIFFIEGIYKSVTSKKACISLKLL